MNCDSSTGCYAIKNYPVIKLSEYGSVKGDENIMAEIYARGPVSAYINAVSLILHIISYIYIPTIFFHDIWLN